MPALDEKQKSWIRKMSGVLDVETMRGGNAGASDVALPSIPSVPPEIVDLLKKLVGRRVCVITVVNKTNGVLRRGADKHEGDAGFETFPPDEIQAGKDANFLATSPANNPIADCIGEMGWFPLDADTTWKIKWSNPRVGSTSGESKITGLNAALFSPDKLVGKGDTAQFRFTIFGGPKKQKPKPKTKPKTKPSKPGDDENDASCLVTVTNKTTSTLTLLDQGHELGDFMTFPSSSLEPGASTQFASVETPDSTDQGCKGFLVWEVGSDGTKWRVEWNNPEQERNLTTSKLEGPQSAGFRELDQIGQGDENVPVKFTISGSGKGGKGKEKVGNLGVTVVDKKSGKAIEGAAVQVGKHSDKTSNIGMVNFLGIAVGIHNYQVQAAGFEADKGTVKVEEDTNMKVLLTAKPGGPGEKTEFKPPTEQGQPTLRKGDESADGWVEYLQARLNKQFGKRVVDSHGKFDSTTHKWVIEFQKREKLMVDGIVGNQTWAALREAKPQPPSTDGRQPHTHVEQGAEARWMTEDNEFLRYKDKEDELSLMLASVGDTRLEGQKATFRVTPATGEPQAFKVDIDPSFKSSTSGHGHAHLVRVPRFKKTFKSGKHLVEAYFEKELGGDYWKGEVEVKEGKTPGGKTPSGKTPRGKTRPPGGTGTANLEVHVSQDRIPASGVTVRLSTGPTKLPDQVTDTNGMTLFRNLVPGEYHVNAAFDAFVWQPGHVKKGKLVPGETFPITLNEVLSGHLRVTVVTEDKDVVPGATVSISPAHQGSTTTAADGRAFYDLLEGQYQVTAVTADGRSGSTSAKVRANKLVDVVVKIPALAVPATAGV